MNETERWWNSLPLIRKSLIIDYKFTDYKWDSLNSIDRQLVEAHRVKNAPESG